MTAALTVMMKRSQVLLCMPFESEVQSGVAETSPHISSVDSPSDDVTNDMRCSLL